MTHAMLGYRLGLPAWAHAGWKNRFFNDQPSQLASYARVFNTVEGNTTFYHTPDDATVRRWADAVAGTDFKFCFKLPRDITHEAHPNARAVARFLDVLTPLRDHLGPMLIQLPAQVGPGDLPFIETLLRETEGRVDAAVEVRHPALFSEPGPLDTLLASYGASRATLDARPIHLGDLSHPDVERARHKKPDLPLHAVTINNTVMVRLVLHPDGESNQRWLDEWVARAAEWLTQGVSLWMMIHCPNNDFCPEFADAFHRQLSAHPALGVTLGDLPPWPVPQQMSLV